ncbi:hypothetical protein ACFPM3_11300 [Streptomyces coeruleoprunus]|uniref:Uncharacterized protein n=1 Tax=Streptomyces coeruleoprunus TaxID=285563 RepID=A0ABV9XGM8_9ACTN
MHHDTPSEITTLSAYSGGLPGLVRPTFLPEDSPPGIALVTLPSGVRTLAYVEPTTPPAPPAPAAAAPIPTWAKTTALLTPTIGGGIAAAGIGLSYAAPGLIAMSHALWATVALIATGAFAVPLLIRSTRGRATTTTHITQNITATGLFGRAGGTINHH